MRLNFQIQSGSEETRVRLSGWIDELAEWPEFEDPLPGDLILDLADVGLLNSMGVRGWIKWVDSLNVERDVRLANCSPAVVKQINILDGFLNDRTKIESIQVPYFCEDCGFEENKLLVISDLPKDPTPPLVVHSYSCPKCAKNMELDMVESQYLAFLKSHRGKFGN